MIYKFILLSLFLTFSNFISFAQESINISGNLVDSSNGESLVFVNIGIEGTLIGTASNAFGEFQLLIPSEQIEKNLYFSAIGYENLSIPVQKYINENLIEIKLKPLSYGIDDIEISTASRVLYKIINDAAQAIPLHFINKSLNYKAMYRSEEFINQESGKKRDAIVLVSDASGYESREFAFTDRNYRFLNVQRNFEIKSLNDGTTLMDELLSFDVARSSGNILDHSYLNEYDLELAKNQLLGKDSVWVIEYKLANPDISRTGDLNATSYKGKLYISKEKNILLKVETHIKSKIQSPQGRTIAIDPAKAQRNVDYHFTTTYKKASDGYIIDRISLIKSYLNTKKENVKIVSSLILINEDTSQPKMIPNRQYYEKMISDPDFWLSNGLKN